MRPFLSIYSIITRQIVAHIQTQELRKRATKPTFLVKLIIFNAEKFKLDPGATIKRTKVQAFKSRTRIKQTFLRRTLKRRQVQLVTGCIHRVERYRRD